MRSWIKKFLTLTLALLLVFSCTGCNLLKKDKPLSQWDYFEEYASYILYTTDPEHKDYEAWKGWGHIRDSVGLRVGIRNHDIITTKEDLSPSIMKNYYEFSITPYWEKIDQIIVKGFTIDVGSMYTQTIEFELYKGSTYVSNCTITVNAGDLTTLKFNFAPLTWYTGQTGSINIRLKEPNLVKSYTLENLKMDIVKK